MRLPCVMFLAWMLIAAAPECSASLPGEFRTGVREWSGFGKSEKRAFLLGFIHASLAKGPPEPYLTPLEVEKLIPHIDALYADKRNTKIPLMDAVHIAALIITGTPQKEVNRVIQASRKSYKDQW